ncbi:methionine--tRNA ligase [Methanofollis formosanus]|uniref:Methionine--tRNA ligase n=1 Tax=Methanofollis formosanus TaxID=299308 RepID=A0A8G1EGB7_9EURY|nr:methionine--tRNA ligase [Methanofollis formosanus]QYZ78752.1 methionine--tRNA ligase [Methanofollis formosanus]
MSGKPLLVTCGLPYTNGPCHLGHLRTYVPADFYVRYLRRCGEDVVFICGSDNHGTPIVISAEQEGTTPRDLAMRYHAHFDETFKRMEITFDHFGMTDDEMNHRQTQAMVQALVDNGYVYSETIQQSYCTTCKRFLPDRYVEGICPYCGAAARGDECDRGCGRHLEPGEIKNPICKVCGSPAEMREQEHYFFKLGEFKEFLLEHLSHLGGTANARNYATGWVREELHDWCITRTLDWGVKFPGRDDLVVYVWVDAPIGYISFTREWAEETGNDWKRYWRGDGDIVHFIGSDIIYHHCIFWPALLSGAGYGTPSAVVASGMVKIDDQKFSKSRGYVVWTNEDYLDQGLPADYLRYYLLSYTSHTKELNFSWKVFQERVNSEIVNTLGNFLYRTLHFAQKFFGGVPAGTAAPEVTAEIERSLAAVDHAVREYEFKGAVDAMMALAAYGNTHIQNHAPWKLIKEDREAAAQVIVDCLQVAKALTLLVEPVLPEAAQRAWEMLGHEDAVSAHPVSEGLAPVQEGALPAPSPLFARLEDDQVAALEKILEGRVAEAKKKELKTMTEANQISIDDFATMDLRVARVLATEPVKGSKKLLKIQVDLGDEQRQVVSGIAPFYNPEDLVGKSVVMIANLKPAKIFGIESNGMILAAGEEASLLTPLRDVKPGTKIC